MNDQNLSLPLFSISQSRHLRDRGIEIAASYPNDEWVSRARSIAEMLAAKNGQVSINDVLKIFPKPDYIHPNALGPIMRSKRLKFSHTVMSDKVSAHARRIGVYTYRDPNTT